MTTAILEFKKSGFEFTLTNNYFSLPNEIVNLEIDKSTIVGINENKITLQYVEPNLEDESFESIDVPFLFFDLDFDEVKELILTEANQGQKFGDA